MIFILLISVSVKLLADKEKISGHKNQEIKIISLDFKKIPVRELLQFIAEAMGCNIIMSESVTGNLALHFKNVTWQQAFHIILEMTGFVSKQIDNVLLIASPLEFANRQKSVTEAALVKTFKIKLYHAQVSQVMAQLKNEDNILSPIAKVSANVEDNSLWIKENVENIPLVTSFIHQRDKVEKQILILAKIINLDDKKVHELGIKFRPISREKSDQGLTLSFPEGNSPGLNLAIASIAQWQLLNLELAALEASGYSKIMADPKIVTLNHQPAIIEAGEEIPYQEKTASGATNVSFKKAALSLKVTPTVLPDRSIILELEIKQNKISSLSVNGTPAIQTQELKTQVIIGNRQTIILGGIYETTNCQVVEKIPVLSHLPLVGQLLSHCDTQQLKKQLLIFVTPEIIGNVHG